MAIVRVNRVPQEMFLTNPRGRRTKKRIRNARRKNMEMGFHDDTGFHPIRASADYSPAVAGENWKTVGFKFKHKAGYKSKYKRRKKNVLGEVGLLIGNSKGGVKKMTRKRKKYSRRRTTNRTKNPVYVRRPKRRHIRHNRISSRRVMSTHRRRRSNPLGMGTGTMALLQQILVGGVSALATTAVPVWFKTQLPLMKYGSQVATAVIGKYLINAIKMPGNIWMIVSLSLTAADAIKEYLLPRVPMLTASGTVVTVPSGTPAEVQGQISVGGAGARTAAEIGTAAETGVSGYLKSGLGAYINKMPKNYALRVPRRF